jgi:DNA-binding CsgD family transcriptional regulator
MIQDTSDLSALIEAIYDTTLDRTIWPDALAKAAEFVGGPAATIFSKNPSAGNGNIYYESGTDPYYRDLYFEKYVKLDPATTGHYWAAVEQPIATADLMPYPEFLETRFYKEWARPQGLVDFVSAVLDKSVTTAALFGVFRHERNGVVDEDTRRRMRIIVPHIRRAVLIGNVLQLNHSETKAFADTLGGLAAGVFLVDKSARIVFANASGQAMLDEGGVLCRKNDALAAIDPRAGTTLSDAIASAGEGDGAVGAKGIAVPLSLPPQDVWLGHILPLTSGARQSAGLAYSAVAAVFAHKASVETPSAMEAMAKSYRLTPGELRVLNAMNDVGPVSSVAEALGISEATVKTHLQHLFAKTGTKRQAELVKLVAAHASPLRDVR